MRDASWIERAARLHCALLLAAVASQMLLLGGALPGAEPLALGLLLGALGLWMAARLMTARGGATQPRRLGWAGALELPPLAVGVPLLGLGCYLIMQEIPLPSALTALLSPQRVAQAQWLRGSLGEAPSAWLSLSVNAEVTRRSLVGVLLALLSFAGGAALGRERRLARGACAGLLGLAVLQALLGVTGVYGRLFAHGGWPAEMALGAGTFPNRNHYAAVLALLMPVALGLFFHHVMRAGQALASHRWIMPRLTDILASSGAVWWALAPPLLAVGIVHGASRGGLIALGIGLTLFFLGSRHHSPHPWVPACLGMAGLVLMLAVAGGPIEAVAERFGDARELKLGRWRLWRDSLGMARDYPLSGVGLGNFATVYMQYATRDTSTYPYQAHNEWLELVLTLGVLGTGWVVALGIGLVRQVRRVLREAGGDYPWLLGIACGLAALMMHCLVEFNLHVPGVSLPAALLTGVLVGTKVARVRTH